MTYGKPDHIQNLDRQWDQYVGGSDVGDASEDADLNRIAQLHALDDAPPAPNRLRERLLDELEAMYPVSRAFTDSSGRGRRGG